MEPLKIPLEILLKPHELELLDRARSLLIPPFFRSKFVLLALQYGLIALSESGTLDLSIDGRTPKFVHQYGEWEDRVASEESAKNQGW